MGSAVAMKLVVNLGAKQERWLRRSRMLAWAIYPILCALVRVNRQYLRQYNVPRLYDSGVRYQPEPQNTVEEFAAIPVVLERKWGDCDDLAPWRVAELREQGENAKIRIQWRALPNGNGRLFHIVVRRGDGSIEDPSARLGMHGRYGA